MRFDAAPDAAQPRPAAGVRTAAAVVGDFRAQPILLATEPDSGVAGAAVLGDVGQRLGDRVVDGRLDRDSAAFG
jgi:hypothetical protein